MIKLAREQAVDLSKAIRKLNGIKWYENLAVVVTDWHTGGRGSEGAHCSFEIFRWDYASKTLCGEWNQQKVGNAKLVHFASAVDGYYLDFYNAMACLRVVGNADRFNNFGGDVDNICWVFKNMAYHSKPIEVINETIKKCSFYYNKEAYKVPSEMKKIARSIDLKTYSSTSFRSGSANHIMSNGQCCLKHAVANSGHDHVNICALFEYITVQDSIVLMAQRALGNWPIVKAKCGQAPSLAAILNEHRLPAGDLRRFVCFMKDLLSITNNSSLGEEGHLWILSCSLMASLLQYLQAMIDDDSEHDDIVVATILQKAHTWKFPLDVLLSFGAIIDTQWKKDNHILTNQDDENTLQAF